MSSPLERAVETAELLAGRTVDRESALIEMDWGDWEGNTLDELRDAHGAAFDQNEARGLDFRPPNGESPRDVHERLKPWLERIAGSSVPVIAVTHLGVLRVILVRRDRLGHDRKAARSPASDAIHRFAVDRNGRVTVDDCNLALVPAAARIGP